MPKLAVPAARARGPPDGTHEGNPRAPAGGAAPPGHGPVYFRHMVGIILEGVLFVALVATVATLICYVILRWTPLGLRLRQTANRVEIEQALDLECPIHGPQREEEMVRLPSGSRICPACYKEALHE